MRFSLLALLLMLSSSAAAGQAPPATRPAPHLAGYTALGPPWPKKIPAWAKAGPEIQVMDGEDHFVAVGKAKAKNLALAQIAAANRARADILRHAMGSSDSYVEGAVKGSRVVQMHKAKNGFVYVQVAAPVSLNQAN